MSVLEYFLTSEPLTILQCFRISGAIIASEPLLTISGSLLSCTATYLATIRRTSYFSLPISIATVEGLCHGGPGPRRRCWRSVSKQAFGGLPGSLQSVGVVTSFRQCNGGEAIVLHVPFHSAKLTGVNTVKDHPNRSRLGDLSPKYRNTSVPDDLRRSCLLYTSDAADE